MIFRFCTSSEWFETNFGESSIKDGFPAPKEANMFTVFPNPFMTGLFILSFLAGIAVMVEIYRRLPAAVPTILKVLIAFAVLLIAPFVIMFVLLVALAILGFFLQVFATMLNGLFVAPPAPAPIPGPPGPAAAPPVVAPAPVSIVPRPTEPAVSSAAPITGSCPTTADAKLASKVDLQRLGTESCAFVWRGVPPATVAATCPPGFVCTFDVVNDIVVVHTGVGQSAQIRAGTWRFMGSYPGENSCTLFKKEAAFAASEIPTFQVRFQASKDGSGAAVGPQTCQ